MSRALTESLRLPVPILGISSYRPRSILPYGECRFGDDEPPGRLDARQFALGEPATYPDNLLGELAVTLPLVSTSMSPKQASSGAMLRTSTVPPLRSGETVLATMHLAWNGKRILSCRLGLRVPKHL
jgi:hypothetical protein